MKDDFFDLVKLSMKTITGNAHLNTSGLNDDGETTSNFYQ
jgi:hypothetical protein